MSVCIYISSAVSWITLRAYLHIRIVTSGHNIILFDRHRRNNTIAESITYLTSKFELLTNSENDRPAARSVCDMMYVPTYVTRMQRLPEVRPSVPYMDSSGLSINIVDEDGLRVCGTIIKKYKIKKYKLSTARAFQSL